MFKSEQLRLFEYRSLFPAKEAVHHKQDEDIKSFLWQYVDILSPRTNILNTNNALDLNRIAPREYDSIVNLSKINNTRCITKFLNSINRKLQVGGTYICCAETLEQRRVRLFAKHNPIVFYPYYFADFIVNRACPKLLLTKKLYHFFRRGNNRVLSMPELLGRFVFSGFRIINSRQVDGLTYFVIEKEKDPVREHPPADGMILKIRKVGRDGKTIKIYKLRTMYIFSEYIQKYIYENNHLKKGGKINNDFRITGWGRLLRKYWIDELPMLWNLVKGDLKLVGLRPLTEHYLSLYNPALVTKRIKIKPGLIPPFYNDMPHTLEEIMESEEKYIDSYVKHPFKTDMKYFYHAVVNILFKGARSA